ncbi:MAG: hypothetical protein PVI50_04550 [Gammaproteobacteria bacterium]
MAARFSVIEQHFRELDLRDIPDSILLKGIRRTYRRCWRGLQKLHAEPGTDISHELRWQAGYAWIQLRLLDNRHPHRLKPFIAGLDRLGKLLGQDSDLAMPVDALQRHQEIGCSRVRTEFVIALAESRRIALLTTGLKLADRLFAEPPERFGAWLQHGNGHH